MKTIYMTRAVWVYDGERGEKIAFFKSYENAIKQFKEWRDADKKAHKDADGYIVEDQPRYYSEQACVFETDTDGNRVKTPTGFGEEDDYEVYVKAMTIEDADAEEPFEYKEPYWAKFYALNEARTNFELDAQHAENLYEAIMAGGNNTYLDHEAVGYLGEDGELNLSGNYAGKTIEELKAIEVEFYMIDNDADGYPCAYFTKKGEK